MKKVCVYAICKNELSFVQKWYNSMKEADYIVVLDTGSTDGTYEELKKLPIIVKQEVINPWRFDVARNKALDMCPFDCEIMVSVDLDEIFHEGWAQIVKDNWKEDTLQATYKYVWSHTQSGGPARIFYYNKMHKAGYYHWVAPVHEFLEKKAEFSALDEAAHTINLFDSVTLEHFPIEKISRSDYMPLLKLRLKEYPDDYNGALYLTHEYLWHQQYKDSINLCDYILIHFEGKLPSQYLVDLYNTKGLCWRLLKDSEEALKNFSMAIRIDDSYREAYLHVVDTLIDQKLYQLGIDTLNLMEKKTFRHYSWLELDDSFTTKSDLQYSLCYYYLGNKILSLGYASLCLHKDSNNQLFKDNYDIIIQNINEV